MADAGGSRQSPADLEFEFPPDASASRVARRALHPLLTEVGHATAFAVETVASELVTNVVLHAVGGGVLRAWNLRGHGPFRLEVDDSDSAVPQLNTQPTEGGGRGLWLVEQLADAWGFSVRRHGKTVWAEFDPNLPREA